MSPDPWDIGNKEREEIYAKQRTHGPNVDGGTESVGISMEDFDSWSHTKIKKASDDFKPDLANQVSQGWDQLASGFKDALANFKSALDTAIDGSWTGLGAEAAKNAIANYKTHSEQVSDGMALMATKPAEAATAMTQVKSLMPEPVEVTAPTSNSTPDDYKRYQAQEAQRQQKENEARMIMRTVYAPVFQQAANGVPVLPTAPQFADGAPSAIGSPEPASEFGTGGPIEPGKVLSGDNTPVSSAAFAGDPTGGGGLGGAAGAALGAAAGAGGAGGGAGAGGGLAVGAAAGGAAGATAPTNSGSWAGASAGANGGAIPGTYGIGRWARPTNKDDEKDRDDKAAQAALLAPMIAGSVGATAAMPATTVSPMQGMGIAPPPTMVPPGATQHHQDNEEEHFTPEFLVSLDNGNELVGPLPKVSPAVIGVWTEEHVEYQNPPPSPYDPRPRDSEE